MSNDRFSSLAPNKLSKDNKKNLDTTIQKEPNFKKEIEVDDKDKKLNMFKKKPQNTRFSFNHENNDDRNEERDRTNTFQYNKNKDDRNEERDSTNTFQYNKNNDDNSFRKKRRDNHRRESYFDRRKYIKEKEARKKEEEEAKKFKYKDDDFPSL